MQLKCLEGMRVIREDASLEISLDSQFLSHLNRALNIEEDMIPLWKRRLTTTLYLINVFLPGALGLFTLIF